MRVADISYTYNGQPNIIAKKRSGPEAAEKSRVDKEKSRVDKEKSRSRSRVDKEKSRSRSRVE